MSTHRNYPRPDFDRSHHWVSLDGDWDFLPDIHQIGLEERWFENFERDGQQTIRVPYAWETPASKINRHWLVVGWYRRKIDVPEGWDGYRIILNIGASFYHTTAWVDGKPAGEHIGGYDPFHFDITDYVNGSQAEVILRVEAPDNKLYIPHGKQRSFPIDDYVGCQFTPSSGIWQPVWLEVRPATYIDSICLIPGENLDGFHLRVHCEGSIDEQTKLVIAMSSESYREECRPDEAGNVEIVVPVREPCLWSPATPHLYHFELFLDSSQGIDEVHTYSGLRKIETRGREVYLNGERIYLRGVLDQGYWADSGMTPPSSEALREDIELAASAGYNLVRKHLKLEDPRYYYYADVMGMLIWAEPPNVGRYSPEGAIRFEEQIRHMIRLHGNHPSIIFWGLYNEEWGLNWEVNRREDLQAVLEHAYNLAKQLDPTRPIIDNSGWWHVKSDVYDWHYYDEDALEFKNVVSRLAADPQRAEFGHSITPVDWYQTRLSVDSRELPQAPIMSGEYGGGVPLDLQGWLLQWQTQEIRRQDIFCGYIYTELFDIEYEKVGIYDEWRELKSLGCHPAHINAETLILINIDPLSPGIDLLVSADEIELRFQIAHSGKSDVDAEVSWFWDGGCPDGHMPVHAEAFKISQEYSIKVVFPSGKEKCRLFLRLATPDTQSNFNLRSIDVLKQ